MNLDYFSDENCFIAVKESIILSYSIVHFCFCIFLKLDILHLFPQKKLNILCVKWVGQKKVGSLYRTFCWLCEFLKNDFPITLTSNFGLYFWSIWETVNVKFISRKANWEKKLLDNIRSSISRGNNKACDIFIPIISINTV